MAKRKTGLHKQVKSIFDGIPKPDNNINDNSHASANVSPQRSITFTLPPKPQTTETQIKKQQPDIARGSKPADSQKAVNIEAVGNNAKTQIQQLWGKIKERLFAEKPGVSPARQKAMVFLVPILAIILIVILSQVFITPSTKAEGRTEAKSAKVPDNCPKQIDWKVPALYPDNLRDPMQPASVTKTADSQGTQVDVGNLVVKGIAYSEDNPSAIIGTQIVYEGEKISDITVSKINKDNVEFEKDGKKWTQQVQR